MSDELLQQVRLLDPHNQVDRVADVLIGAGQIVEIAERITPGPGTTRRRDCTGLVLGPGLVDLYSYTGEPGFEARETLASLGAAAIAGGFTRLTLLPDTQPAFDAPDGLLRLQAHRPRQLPLRIQAWGAITHNLEGQHLVDLTELAAAGVVGFSDGRPLTHWTLVRRLLEYVAPLKLPIALWPLQPSLAGQGVVREGGPGIRLGLPECPSIAETTALAALLEIVAMVRTPVHIMRVSTARSVQLIATAKAQGLPITASTSWMHLLWNTTDLATYDSNLRLDPPVGNPEDQAALIEAVATGVVDAIAIDHRAYTMEEKTVAFGQAPGGAIGLELALPILWQTLVETQRWSAIDLWAKLSLQPAHCLHQHSPTLRVGQPAEMTLFDPQATWQVSATSLKTLGHNTPWWGKTVTGKVIQTWCPLSSDLGRDS